MDAISINDAKRRKAPFYLDGKFLDYETGGEYFNTKTFAGPYEGACFIGRDLFRTWMQDEERNWKCIELAS